MIKVILIILGVLVLIVVGAIILIALNPPKRFKG
jgi:hypothetical protein